MPSGRKIAKEISKAALPALNQRGRGTLKNSQAFYLYNGKLFCIFNEQIESTG